MSANIVPLLLLAVPAIDCALTIQYNVYSNENPNNYTSFNETSDAPVTNYAEASFDPSNKVVLLCHGWRDTDDVQWYDAAVATFMTMPNYLVVEAHYPDAVANITYLPAVENVPILGAMVGDLITALNQNESIPLDQFEIVGHSLGAHVAGYAGARVLKNLAARILRIFGLDPAWPGYYYTGTPVQTGNAQYVYLFHTSYLGLQTPNGNLDFYPNGGVDQGMCGLLNDGSHTMATTYFNSGLARTCNYTAVLCDSYANMDTKCKRNPQASMSYWVDNTAINGTYYLNTTCPCTLLT